MKRRTDIEIELRGGRKTVPAYVFGEFAAHVKDGDPTSKHKALWTVTHVRSGLAAKTGLDYRPALELARKLSTDPFWSSVRVSREGKFGDADQRKIAKAKRDAALAEIGL